MQYRYLLEGVGQLNCCAQLSTAEILFELVFITKLLSHGNGVVEIAPALVHADNIKVGARQNLIQLRE